MIPSIIFALSNHVIWRKFESSIILNFGWWYSCSDISTNTLKLTLSQLSGPYLIQSQIRWNLTIPYSNRSGRLLPKRFETILFALSSHQTAKEQHASKFPQNMTLLSSVQHHNPEHKPVIQHLSPTIAKNFKLLHHIIIVIAITIILILKLRIYLRLLQRLYATNPKLYSPNCQIFCDWNTFIKHRFSNKRIKS